MERFRVAEFYLTIFVIAALVSGLWFSLLGLLFDRFSLSAAVFQGAFFGTFFGCLLTLFVSRRHVTGVRETLRAWKDRRAVGEVLSPHQSGEVILPLSADLVTDLCDRVIESEFLGSKRERPEPDRWTIRTSPYNPLTHGEQIDIRIAPLDDQLTSVSIRSRPLWRFAYADAGADLNNVKRIAKGIKARAGAAAIASP